MGFFIENPKRTLRLHRIILILLLSSVVILFSVIISYSNPLLLIFLGISVSITILFFTLHRDMMVTRASAKLSIYCSKGGYDKALNWMDKRINSNMMPYRVNWLALKSMVLIKKEELNKADRILKKILNRYPNFIQALYFKACLEDKKGNKKRALKYLNRTLNTQKKVLGKLKEPISKRFAKKRLEKSVQLIKKDEDLEELRKTPAFDKTLTRHSTEQKSINIPSAMVTAIAISITLTFLLWMMYSKIYLAMTVSAFLVMFTAQLVIQKVFDGI